MYKDFILINKGNGDVSHYASSLLPQGKVTSWDCRVIALKGSVRLGIIKDEEKNSRPGKLTNYALCAEDG